MAGDDDLPRGEPPNLSRIQVYLYALLALFGGVLFAGPVRSALAPSLADPGVVLFAVVGALLGGALAVAALAVVLRGMGDLSPERRYRLSRLHTISLTGVVVAFLVVATVRPSLLAPPPDPSGIGFLTNEATTLPLVAAATTLVVLGVVYRRRNRRP